MDKSIFIPFIALLLTGCNSNNSNTDSANANVAPIIEETADSMTEEVVAEDEEVSPWSKVTRWVITVTSVSTIEREISKAEADRLNATLTDDDDKWVNEVDGTYMLHGHGEAVLGKVVITDSKYVSQLNRMMEESRYSEYRDLATIKGTTATAKWDSGNRGGGISEEFPNNLSRYILDKVGF